MCKIVNVHDTPPLKNWLKEENDLLRYFMLDTSSILSFFSKNILLKMYNYNLLNNYNLSNHLWIILVLGVWLEANKNYIEIEF